MRSSIDMIEAAERRKRYLRIFLFSVILATLPCYILGIGIWLTAPDPQARNRAATQDALELTGPAVSNTPLGGDVTLTNLPAGPSPFLTWTPLSPLLPTPGQFVPPPPIILPSATWTFSFVPLPDTAAPTITPTFTFTVPPTLTFTPTETATDFPTETPLPPPSETPLPPPTDTPDPGGSTGGGSDGGGTDGGTTGG